MPKRFVLCFCWLEIFFNEFLRHIFNYNIHPLLCLCQLAHQCMREVRRAAIQAQKNCKETLPRARRLTKEMMLYWKKYEKVEKEHRKRAEKEALEQRKLDEEMREVGGGEIPLEEKSVTNVNIKM